MATVVTTRTATTATLVLHLREHTPDELIDEFLHILEVHQELGDPLSIDLIQWGEELALLLAEGDALNIEQVAIKLHELRKILINPLDGSPLEEPQIAGGRIWEKWMLTQVKDLFEDTSCYPDGASLVDVENHPFAEEILQWLANIIKSSHPKLIAIRKELEKLQKMEDTTGYLSKEECLHSRRHLLIHTYTKLAALTDQCKTFTDMADRVSRSREQFQTLSQATQEQTQKHLKALKISLAKGREKTEKDLEGIRTTIQRLRESLEEARKEHATMEGRVTAAESRVDGLASRITSLEHMVCELEAQNQRNWAAANSGGGGGGGCIIM